MENKYKMLIALVLVGVVLLACAVSALFISRSSSTQVASTTDVESSALSPQIPSAPPQQPSVQNPSAVCGDGTAAPTETCSSCPSDVKCAANAKCCGNICLVPDCTADADCNDNNKLTKDTCLAPSFASVVLRACSAHCSHVEIRECINADGACPSGCNSLFDTDCPAYDFNKKIIMNKNTEIQLSNPQFRRCETYYDSAYIDDEDYGSYLILNLHVENNGKEAGDFIAVQDFYLLDSSGKQYDAEWWVSGETCADNKAYQGGQLFPGANRDGELWFKISEKGTRILHERIKIIYDGNMYTAGDELVFIHDV